MLRQLIQEFVIRQLNVDARKFENDNLMVADLGLDSLGVVEMLFEVEERYGFQIDEPARYRAMSFNDMVSDMEASIRAHYNGQIPDPATLASKR